MSNLTIRDPFADFNRLIESTFGPRLGRDGNVGLSPFSSSHRFELPVNVYETDDGIGIEAWLPGFEEDEISVTVDDRTLKLRAEKRTETVESSEDGESNGNGSDGSGEAKAEVVSDGGRRYRRREVSHRVLSRSFYLGEDYDPSTISAHLKNGVLEVTIDRAPESQPTRIEINRS